VTNFSTLFAGRSDRLVLPSSDKEKFERYIRQQSIDRGNAEDVPFPRQVDFWVFCICTALAMEMEPRKGAISSWGAGFIYVYQGILSEDVAAFLAVVAIAKMGHKHPNVGNPAKIIELANRLAGAGCPIVLQKLTEDSIRTTPLDRAISLARSLQSKVCAGE